MTASGFAGRRLSRRVHTIIGNGTPPPSCCFHQCFAVVTTLGSRPTHRRQSSKRETGPAWNSQWQSAAYFLAVQERPFDTPTRTARTDSSQASFSTEPAYHANQSTVHIGQIIDRQPVQRNPTFRQFFRNGCVANHHYPVRLCTAPNVGHESGA